MKLMRRSQSGAVGEAADKQVSRPATIPKALPTRDVRTLLVAHAVMENAKQTDTEAGIEPESSSDSIPKDVRAWAQSVLGEGEVCTCSIHCQQRPSSA